VHHLNQVINWYRHAMTGVLSVGLPSDTICEALTCDTGNTVWTAALRAQQNRK
jgi:hypothetical protein